jgi:hypothetical protein
MDYPLHMHHAGRGGYAVANDQDEHKALSEHGYEPKFEEPAEPEKKEPAKKAK